MPTVLQQLNSTCPIRIPHVWAGGYSGAVCGEAELLKAWIRASGSFSVSIDSMSPDRLHRACVAAKSLGMTSLPVCYWFSPFPPANKKYPDKTHPAGLWDDNDILRPMDDAKWTAWDLYWSARAADWAVAAANCTAEFRAVFLRPTVFVNCESFRRFSHRRIAIRGVSESEWDVDLGNIYRRARRFASERIAMNAPQIWYKSGDYRRTKTDWELCPDWPLGFEPTAVASPTCYTPSDVGECIARYTRSRLLGPLSIAPNWTCCGEWLPTGWADEPQVDRVKYPHVRGHDVAYGAFLASEYQLGNLYAAVTWPAPGTSNCSPEIFAERWLAMAEGVNCGITAV